MLAFSPHSHYLYGKVLPFFRLWSPNAVAVGLVLREVTAALGIRVATFILQSFFPPHIFVSTNFCLGEVKFFLGPFS